MLETWRQRAKRAMKGRITQERLAEKLEMTQGGLGHWLNGRTQPTLEDINRIADEIGVSRVWLTHGLGYADGPGKRLLDVLLSGQLGDPDLEPLAVTAERLAAARPNRAAESVEIYGKPPPSAPEDAPGSAALNQVLPETDA